MKKVAIVGSRRWKNLSKVHEFVASLPPDTIIVSGGAMGVDSAATEAARRNGLPTKVFMPDWFAHGRVAGFMRNSLIVDYADEVYAFHQENSPGTRDTIRKAEKAGKLKKVFLPNQS